MGAPVGNQFAAKAKQWAAAIDRALERLGDPSIDPDQPIARTPYMKGIDQAADAFVAEMFAKKDLGFFKEFGDRTDGKPVALTELTGRDGGDINTRSKLVVAFEDVPPRTTGDIPTQA